MEGNPRRCLKSVGAIGLDGGKSQHTLDRVVHSKRCRRSLGHVGLDSGSPFALAFYAHRIGRGILLNNADVLGRTPGYVGNALVDIIAVIDTGFSLDAGLFGAGPFDGTGDDRRLRPRPDRLGIKNVLFAAIDQLPVSVGVGQVQGKEILIGIGPIVSAANRDKVKVFR